LNFGILRHGQKDNQMKKTIPVVSLIVLTLAGALFRFVNIAGHSGGAGGGANSPNNKFLAAAMSFEGEKFWGGKYSYYEFTLTSSNGQQIYHSIIEDPPKPLSDWREESDRLIHWSPDSSSVDYAFNGGHLILSVTP
jgi:hypothetical protein